MRNGFGSFSEKSASTWVSSESKVTWTVQWNVVYIFRLKV